MASSTYDLIVLALQGDKQAAQNLVRILTPIFEREAARVVFKVRGTREDVKQLVNDIFADLFDHRGAALRKYRPERGAPPEYYFRIFARLKCQTFARAERDAYLETLLPPQDIQNHRQNLPIEGEQEQSFFVQQTLNRMAATLSIDEFELFIRRYVKHQTTKQISQELGISEQALYQRIRRLALSLKKHGFT